MGQYTQAVQQLYVAYFNRPADPVGLAYWESRLLEANGRAAVLAEISNAFSVSAEYTSVYGGRNEVAVVDQVYQNLFGRHAETKGLMYWANLLASNKVSVAHIVTTVASGALNTDLAAYNAKVSAATSFTNGLTTKDQIDNYVGDAALILAKNYIGSVKDAATLASATQASALAATISAVLAAGETLNNVSKNFILTASEDNFVGGSGDDTFTAFATSTQTLNASDKLDGGAGNNDLQLTSKTGKTVDIFISAELKNIQTANFVVDAPLNLETTRWAGLTKLQVTSVGATHIVAASPTNIVVKDVQTTGQIEVQGGNNVSITATSAYGAAITVGTKLAPVGDVIISRANSLPSGGNGGPINVTGGKTIAITTVSGNPVDTTETHGPVTILGSSLTTSVSVLQSPSATKSASTVGVEAGVVSVTDVNGGAASLLAGTITTVTIDSYTTVSISDNALKTLSLANGSGDVTIDNSSSLANVTNKTLGLTVNALKGGTLDDADIYTTLNVTTTGAASTLANISFGAVTAMSVAGSKDLILNSTAGMSKLSTVNVSGSAGLNANLSAASVTAVDTSATSGASKVSLDTSKASFTGGAGIETVINSATVSSKAINLGAGDDSLMMDNVKAIPTAKIDGGAGIDTLSIKADLASEHALATVVTGFERLVLSGANKQTIDLGGLGKFNHVSLAGAGAEGVTLSNMPSAGTLVLTGAGEKYTISGDADAVSGKSEVLNVKLINATTDAISFASKGITAAAFETVLISTSDTKPTPTGTFKDSITFLGNTVSNISVTGNAGLHLTATSTALSNVDASGISLGGFKWESGALTAAATVKGSLTANNEVNLKAATAAVNYIGGKGVDTVVVGAGAHVLTMGAGTGPNTDTVSITALNSSINIFTTITDARAGLKITLPEKGNEEFDGRKIILESNSTFQEYLNKVVTAGGDADQNGKGGWFQFSGDTYYVQSQHNGTTLTSFQTDKDFIVKLTGSIDLSSARLDGNSLTIG